MNIFENDTIAAISTAMTNAGIGIIRVSGENAIEVVDKVYVNKYKKRKLKEYLTHTIHYGYIIDDATVVDEVMVSIMKAPNSFTMEDTVEINCHGGVLVMKKILALVVGSGARLAEPGEFSKRAFLNGRIDLSKAEAIMELIHAKNEMSLKTSISHLSGSIYELIIKLRADILYEIAFIESALDDPEHVSLEGYYDSLSAKLTEVKSNLSKLEDSFKYGRIIKEGIQTAIIGRPNVGKSSLLNYMAGTQRAIVTDIAGTTRDTIEQEINIDGIHLNMIDTAGIRNTDDIIEKIGVEKSKEYIKEADLVVYMIDASCEIGDDDYEIMENIKDSKTIVLLNKSDLESIVDEHLIADTYKKVNGADIPKDIFIIEVSVKEERGFSEFRSAIKTLFMEDKIRFNEEVAITNLRQYELIKDAIEALKMVEGSIADDMPEDFISIDLMSAYSALGFIIGEEVSDDVVNEIFGKFCTGK